jgi:nucleoside-diphosphate-sugar epimerase
MNPQKILITGGAGYLGCVITEHLLALGHDVTVLDNLMYNQPSLLHLNHMPNFKFLCGDCRDEELMKEICPGFDFIIPLAAIVGAPACDRNQQAAISTNLDAVLMLDKIRERTQKIIYPTTNSGYGTKDGSKACTEETPLEPISLYGKTKVKAERALLASGNAITLRLATVFGISPRMRLDLLVNDFTHRAVKDRYIVIFEKDFKRNYIHIMDVARCFAHCTDNFDKMKNNAYNVGLDKANLSKEELALKIKEYVPDFYIHFAEIGSDPDKRNYIVSNEKLMKTGFRCKFSLDYGIQELIKAFAMLPENTFRNA